MHSKWKHGWLWVLEYTLGMNSGHKQRGEAAGKVGCLPIEGVCSKKSSLRSANYRNTGSFITVVQYYTVALHYIPLARSDTDWGRIRNEFSHKRTHHCWYPLVWREPLALVWWVLASELLTTRCAHRRSSGRCMEQIGAEESCVGGELY